MSHFASVALSVLVLAAACSSKPPEGPAAEVPEASEPGAAEAAAAAEPGAPEPATPQPGTPEATLGDPPLPSAAPASEAPATATLFVREVLADCQGEGARKCLQVRGAASEQWRNFFGSIEGFDYQPAYAYELRVAVTHIDSPPPDAPSIHYRLLEVVSKKAVK
jgi:uncharacterized protein DUF4377